MGDLKYGRLMVATMLFIILPALGAPQMALADVTAALSKLDITAPKRRLDAPEFELPDLNGRMHALSDFRGRIVLLNFWATFCAPCREEMPDLEFLWQRYGPDHLVVIGVAADRGASRVVREFTRDNALTFPILLDPDGTVRNIYEVMGLPTTYIIGRDGRFIGRVIGERKWASNAGLALIESLIDDVPKHIQPAIHH